ncbi:MAG: hypothetical protein V6Z81_09625 [Parvularculales bacterium]
MMTSKPDYSEIYVWIWLPGATEPVVAGKLVKGPDIEFNYGQSYLARKDAIPIFDEELPLIPGPQSRTWGEDALPGCIRDASPDAWGRRVILNRFLGSKGRDADPADLDEFT